MIRISRFLEPYSMLITATLVLVFLQTLSTLYLPTLITDIVDHGITRKDTSYIEHIGAEMLAISAAGMICAVAATLLSSRIAAGFGRGVRSRLFTRVESFTLREMDRFGAATLITRTTNDVTQVQMIMAPIMAIGGIILALQQDRPLTLVLAVAIPILLIVIVLIARVAVPLFGLMQVKLDQLNRVMREGLTGIRVIRAFNRTQYQTERFAFANADLTSNAIRVNRLIALLFPVLMLVMNLTGVAIIWFGAVRINGGGMQVGSLIAFVQYAMQIMFAFMMVSMMFVIVPRGAASAFRINEVLDAPTMIYWRMPDSTQTCIGVSLRVHNVLAKICPRCRRRWCRFQVIMGYGFTVLRPEYARESRCYEGTVEEKEPMSTFRSFRNAESTPVGAGRMRSAWSDAETIIGAIQPN